MLQYVAQNVVQQRKHEWVIREVEDIVIDHDNLSQSPVVIVANKILFHFNQKAIDQYFAVIVSDNKKEHNSTFFVKNLNIQSNFQKKKGWIFVYFPLVGRGIGVACAGNC